MPTHSTDWFVADDLYKDFMNITQHTCGMHWKIRQFYHEIVQLTGIEYNQCRIARFQRNHIILAALVRIRPIGQARKTGQTASRINRALLDDCLLSAAQKSVRQNTLCVSPNQIVFPQKFPNALYAFARTPWCLLHWLKLR